jgi:hypothetical protein
VWSPEPDVKGEPSPWSCVESGAPTTVVTTTSSERQQLFKHRVEDDRLTGLLFRELYGLP